MAKEVDTYKLEIRMVPALYYDYTPRYLWEIVHWIRDSTTLSRAVLDSGLASTPFEAFKEGEESYNKMRSEWVANTQTQSRFDPKILINHSGGTKDG